MRKTTCCKHTYSRLSPVHRISTSSRPRFTSFKAARNIWVDRRAPLPVGASSDEPILLTQELVELLLSRVEASNWVSEMYGTDSTSLVTTNRTLVFKIQNLPSFIRVNLT